MKLPAADAWQGWRCFAFTFRPDSISAVHPGTLHRLGHGRMHRTTPGTCNHHGTAGLSALCCCCRCLQKEKGEGKRRELQSHLTRLQQMMSEEKTRRKAKELEQGWKVGGVGRELV